MGNSEIRLIICLLMILITSCAFTPKKPQIAEYVECRKIAHESYLKINPKMNTAKVLDYALLLNTSQIYDWTIDAIFKNTDMSQQLEKEIGHLSCFAKAPSNEEKKWLKPYEIKEANAEASFIFKKTLPIIKTIISQQEIRKKSEHRYLLQEIGTQICKDERGIQYVGFIEHIESEKLQIRISSSSFIGAPNSRPSGFQPSMVWDFPSNWYVCE